MEPAQRQQDYLNDATDALGSVFLGMTVGCARCHDHKFDPISAQDFYAIYGFFSSSKYPFAGSEEDKRPSGLIPLLPKQEAETRIAGIQARLKELNDKVNGFERERKRVEKLPKEQLSPEERKRKLEEIKKQHEAAKKEHEKYFAEASWPKAFAMTEGEGKNAKLQKSCANPLRRIPRAMANFRRPARSA